MENLRPTRPVPWIPNIPHGLVPLHHPPHRLLRNRSKDEEEDQLNTGLIRVSGLFSPSHWQGRAEWHLLGNSHLAINTTPLP